MKAYASQTYGGPEVLKITKVPKPSPKDRQVLVEVKAFSLNPAEWHLMKGSIWMVRLNRGATKPKDPFLGADIAGKVIAVGESVLDFKVGDRVLGRTLSGGMAEYACLDEDMAAILPDKLSYEEGAATPLASATALFALKDKGGVKKGEKILINGASGGIGTFAVQLATYYGGEVTGVCSGKNKKKVLELGAKRVLDYRRDELKQEDQRYDLLLDLVGNLKVNHINQLLKAGGRAVMVGYSGFGNMLSFILQGSYLSLISDKKFIIMDAPTRRKDLMLIAQLMETGKMQVVIEKTYEFDELPKAMKRLGSRRTRGKLVIEV